MLRIKVGLAQTNPVVGDYAHNVDEIKELLAKAAKNSLDLVVFGELAINGYPLGDLSYRRDVIAAGETALEQLTRESLSFPELTIVVGHARFARSEKLQLQASNAIAHNSASVIRNGKILGVYDKQRLPNYDVFDDWRNFIPGQSELVFEVGDTKCAIAICEDIWDPNSERAVRLEAMGVELVVVPNGSPYTRLKSKERREVAKRFSSGLALAYVNLAGGQDELVFDGDSFLLDGRNEVISAGLEPGLYFQNQVPESDPLEKLWHVLVIGLRDYLRKTGQKKIVLGLSGGIDSAVCAALAAEAVGVENVLGVLLPSRYSSDHSITDAVALAERLGIEHRVVEIDEPHQSFENLLDLSPLASENIQARIRAVILMGISNSEGYLLISTGNKSEVAVGYSTIYGDSAGGFAPIKDVYKTDVWALARKYNELRGSEIIPENSISKPPSAELRPGQVDQDSLPDYFELDAILQMLIEGNATLEEVVRAGHARETASRIDQLVRAAEWKRSQGAIGTKTTDLAFGRGRRVPLTTRFGKL
ncbi:NAD+ synthase [Aquiluna borgnonia]|uniref:Glutamine-dependent NAD(+) synthetase n=1 Tax=Aquiluna borgnonia TaxID=2499157 RepID=A0A7D4TIY3_9MICO|nr:NAD+ synthase [Aquiluna borgnonia]QKJ25211.1 NAD+ synthase [Aquiluna borgnonia]